MVAGAAAGCLEVTIMYPTEYVKTQLQLQPKDARLYNGMIDCAVRCGTGRDGMGKHVSMGIGGGEGVPRGAPYQP